MLGIPGHKFVEVSTSIDYWVAWFWPLVVSLAEGVSTSFISLNNSRVLLSH